MRSPELRTRRTFEGAASFPRRLIDVLLALVYNMRLSNLRGSVYVPIKIRLFTSAPKPSKRELLIDSTKSMFKQS